MILKLLQLVAYRRPYFNIVSREDGSLYMGRWWILGGSNTQWDQDHDRPVKRTWKRGRIDAFIGRFFVIRLHHICREDRARDHHNHPASFLSIVVKGWYEESLPKYQKQPPEIDRFPFQSKRITRRAGSIAFRSAEDRHTITRVSPGGVWTVCIFWPKTGRSWGFFTKEGFVHWRNYKVSP